MVALIFERFHQIIQIKTLSTQCPLYDPFIAKIIVYAVMYYVVDRYVWCTDTSLVPIRDPEQGSGDMQ